MDKGRRLIASAGRLFFAEAEGHDSIQQTIEIGVGDRIPIAIDLPISMGKSASPQSLSQRLFF